MIKYELWLKTLEEKTDFKSWKNEIEHRERIEKHEKWRKEMEKEWGNGDENEE